MSDNVQYEPTKLIHDITPDISRINSEIYRNILSTSVQRNASNLIVCLLLMYIVTTNATTPPAEEQGFSSLKPNITMYPIPVPPTAVMNTSSITLQGVTSGKKKQGLILSLGLPITFFFKMRIFTILLNNNKYTILYNNK